MTVVFNDTDIIYQGFIVKSRIRAEIFAYIRIFLRILSLKHPFHKNLNSDSD